MLRVVSYNIRFGGGRRVPLLAATVASLKPDLVLLQEATNPLAVERLAKEAGLGHVVQQPGWSVAALAREAPTSHEWHRPPRGRGFLEVEPAGGTGLRFLDVHLPAGLSLRGERARLRHVDALLEVMNGRTGPMTSLLGDLNSVAPGDEPRVAAMPFWLRLLLRFDGGIRTDVVRRLLGAGWVDAYRHLHPTDAGFTLPPGAPSIRLDYLLVPAPLLPRVAGCEPAASLPLVERASDHLPLVVDIATGDEVA